MSDIRGAGYYAVIPASVRYDDAIPANAKLLYGEISALTCDEEYCYASNSYFADLYGVTEGSITRLITKLEQAGHVVRSVEKDDSGQIIRRRLYLSESISGGQGTIKKDSTPPQKSQGGTIKNDRENNTSINILKENIKESFSENDFNGERSQRTDFDPLPLFVEWIAKTFGDEYSPAVKNSVYFALVRFSENRVAIKKPMKSKGAVTALCNRLLRLSPGKGDLAGSVIDMLDTATSSGWQTVYPAKSGDATPRNVPQSGRCYEEL